MQFDGEAENCLNELSYSEDLDNYELLLWILSSQFCLEDQTVDFHSEFKARVQHPRFGHALLQLGPRAYHNLYLNLLDHC